MKYIRLRRKVKSQKWKYGMMFSMFKGQTFYMKYIRLMRKVKSQKWKQGMMFSVFEVDPPVKIVLRDQSFNFQGEYYAFFPWSQKMYFIRNKNQGFFFYMKYRHFFLLQNYRKFLIEKGRVRLFIFGIFQDNYFFSTYIKCHDRKLTKQIFKNTHKIQPPL